jgi:hypothetical protein
MVLGISGISASFLVIGISFKLADFDNLTHSMWVKAIIYCGTYSMLIYVFHMPVLLLVKKIITFTGLEPGYLTLITLFLSGVLLPLLIGKILRYSKTAYRILIGR